MGQKEWFPKKSPVFGDEKVHKNLRGAKPWNVEEMQTSLKWHRPGSMAWLWFMISKKTLPKISDIVNIGSENIDDINKIKT
jgi:hypothetical protein